MANKKGSESLQSKKHPRRKNLEEKVDLMAKQSEDRQRWMMDLEVRLREVVDQTVTSGQFSEWIQKIAEGEGEEVLSEKGNPYMKWTIKPDPAKAMDILIKLMPFVKDRHGVVNPESNKEQTVNHKHTFSWNEEKTYIAENNTINIDHEEGSE